MKKIENQVLLPEHKIWIINKCDEYLSFINFNEEYSFDKNRVYVKNIRTLYLLQFAIFLNYPLKETQFLDLMKYIGHVSYKTRENNNVVKEHKLEDYIFNNVKKEKLKEKILDNFKKGQLSSHGLVIHAQIIERERWLEGICFLPKYINNPDLESYNKKEILSVFGKLNGDDKILEPILESITFTMDERYFDWAYLDFMVSRKNEKVIEFLESKIGTDIDQLKIGLTMLDAKCPCAFDVILSNLAGFKNNANFSLHTAINKTSPLDFEIQLYVDFLLRLLKQIIDINFNESFNPMSQLIFDKLYMCVILPDVDELEIMNRIENILKVCDKNKTYKIARYAFSDLSGKIDRYLDKNYNIKEAINLLRTHKIIE
jgi:hypothetical protein